MKLTKKSCAHTFAAEIAIVYKNRIKNHNILFLEGNDKLAIYSIQPNIEFEMFYKWRITHMFTFDSDWKHASYQDDIMKYISINSSQFTTDRIAISGIWSGAHNLVLAQRIM